MDRTLDRMFERLFAVSARFSLVRYSVIHLDSAHSVQITSVHKARLMIYENM